MNNYNPEQQPDQQTTLIKNHKHVHKSQQVQQQLTYNKNLIKILTLIIGLLLIIIIFILKQSTSPVHLLKVIPHKIQQKLQYISKYQYIQTKINRDIKPNLIYDITGIAIPKSQIIQINYQNQQYVELPLNPFHLKKYNKKFQELYYTKEQQQKRQQFIDNRKRSLQSSTQKPNILLASYNVPKDEQTYLKGISQNKNDWLRLNKLYNISSVKTELPFCIIVPGYNNNASFRIEHNLNSIFMQNYSNYKVLIIDDASNDGSTQEYVKYFKINKVDKSKYTLLSNQVRASSLPNQYFGILYYCSKDSITIIADGDDELIGWNTLNLFNWGYQTKKSGVLYSNFIRMNHKYKPNYKFHYVHNEQYTKQQKQKSLYRQVIQMKFHHLHSFRTELLYQINPKGLLDTCGKMFRASNDWGLYMPLMELSCGRVDHINHQVSYLANRQTGNNNYQTKYKEQMRNLEHIRKIEKQKCYKDFDMRMRQL